MQRAGVPDTCADRTLWRVIRSTTRTTVLGAYSRAVPALLTDREKKCLARVPVRSIARRC
jgi:hypothetical protein